MAPLLTPTQILSIVKKLRDDIARTSNTTPISIRQHKTSIDPSDRSGSTSTSLPGTVVSKVILPAAQAFAHDARELLHSAIAHLGPGEFPRPEIQPVQGEWLGYSVGRKASPATAGVDVSRDNYRRICETTSDTVIFFVYGGLFFTNIPATVRPTVSKLCKLTGARAFTVRYRLAPQNPFPAALLDVLIAYLSLLYPPPDALHSPIPADRIVFAGDSSGANLLLALTQVLLFASPPPSSSLPTRTIPYQSAARPIPLPARLALISPYADLAHALPSYLANGQWDLIPATTPYLRDSFPADAIWPSSPPRAHIYTSSTLLAHPLVSPAAAWSWAGAPPIWMTVGEERLTDGAMVIVRTARADGVRVGLELYRGMPHVFLVIFQKWWQSARCWASWADAVQGVGTGEGKVEIVGMDGAVRKGGLEDLGSIGPKEARDLMRKTAEQMVPWVGGAGGKSNL